MRNLLWSTSIKQQQIPSFSQCPSCLMRITNFPLNTANRICRALSCFSSVLLLVDCLHHGKGFWTGQLGADSRVMLESPAYSWMVPKNLGGSASLKWSRAAHGFYLLCLSPLAVLFTGSFSPTCRAILQIPALKRVRCTVCLGVHKVFGQGVLW